MDTNTGRISPKVMIIVGGVILVLLVIFVFIVSRFANPGASNPKQTENQPSTQISQAPQNPSAEKKPAPVAGAVAKVGEEYLYESDLSYELSYYPSDVDSNARETLINKLIQDSIILQAADAEGLIELDKSVFNNAEKDYAKRLSLVQEAQDTINERSVTLKGEVISIWFNNMLPGPLGYEKGKDFAKQKITAIHENLVAGRITFVQAANQIKNDTTLAQVDTSYRSNAYFEFEVSANENITIDPEVDREIRSLNAGDLSVVMVGRDTNASTGDLQDAFYMIARATEKNQDAITSFDAWYESKKDLYETELY